MAQDATGNVQGGPEPKLGNWQLWVSLGIEVATVAARVLTAVLKEKGGPAATGSYSIGPLVFMRTDDGTVTVANQSTVPFLMSFAPPDLNAKNQKAEMIRLDKGPLRLNEAFEAYASGSITIAPETTVSPAGVVQRAIAFQMPSVSVGTPITLATTLGNVTIEVLSPVGHYTYRLEVTFSRSVSSVTGEARLQSNTTKEFSTVTLVQIDPLTAIAEVTNGVQFDSTLQLSLNLVVEE